MPRMLLLHASIGMGHQRAAVALAQVCAQTPATTVQVEDTLLAVGVPMLIPTAQLVGQKRWNVAHAIAGSAGIGCESMTAVAQAVDGLLATPARMTAMHVAARALGQPDAAIAVAALVLAELERKDARRPAGAQPGPRRARMAAEGWR